MNRLILLIFLALFFISCSGKVYEIKDEFTQSSAPLPPDYSNPNHWAALPDKKDAADSIPKKTSISDLQATASADVFFIYPTIFTERPENQFHWNADVNDAKLNDKIQRSTIVNQATVFNGAGKIYAPYYRQAHLSAFYTDNKNEALQALNLAYEDVKAAFEYYLKNYNNGRPIIIASHSQGSYHAERLLKDYFDGKDLQSKLIVAYLIGRAISPQAFKNIHPTEKPDEIGVWASWNTYARDHYPKNYEKFFKGSLSTNPLIWNSTDVFAPRELNQGGVGPNFTYLPQLADAQNHEGLLWINKPYIKGRIFIRTKRWHYADINLFYMNIRENAELRVKQFLEMSATR